VLSTVGVYGLNRSTNDLIALYVLGLLGFVMRRYDFPIAPCIIGLILGPLAEEQFRRALSISQGDPSVFLTHPISAGFLVAAVLVLALPALLATTLHKAGGEQLPGGKAS
jgi:putative tricarboxylic transport membrane protein